MDTIFYVSHQLVRRQRDIENNDENIGSARTDNSSLSGLVATLIPTAIIFGVFLLLFLILRRSQRRTYAPRSYVGSVNDWARADEKRILGENGGGFFGWIACVWKAPDAELLRAGGLDGFFFLRYLRKAATILFCGIFFTIPLFVLNAVHVEGKFETNEEEGLDMLSWSNVKEKHRAWAHIFVAYLFFGFIMFTIYREMMYFTAVKQAYLLSPLYASRISSRTVLITSIPEAYVNEDSLLKIFDNVKHIWINQDVTELEELVNERTAVTLKLEAAQVKLIKLADAARRKNGGAINGTEDVEAANESGSVAAKYIEKKDRPAHKLKMFVGEKVDTIDWCRNRLAELNPKIEELQAKHRQNDCKTLNTAFIEFTTQKAAQAAAQTLAHHQPLHMSPRVIGVEPNEVVWANMKLQWLERLIRFAGTTAFVVALVIFWSIPVAFVGLVSQVNYLTERFKFLSFINDIPKPILGVITGLLPAVALAVLMALLPIVLRLMAKIQGAVSLSQVELKTQNMYFTFQVVQVFLVTTLSASASSAVEDIIKDPSKTPAILSESIPKATNFYISYMIVQGLTISSGVLLQMVGLILYRILGFLFDKTPRKQWTRWQALSGLGWGTVFPVYTLLTVITITYSIIAPLIMVFGTIAMFLLYLAYRYNILFVYNTSIDTKGAVYPRALYQTFTGVYLAEIVQIGLFGARGAFGPMVLAIILLVFTILFQLTLSSAMQPLLDFLPRSVGSENTDPTATADVDEKNSNPLFNPAALLTGGLITRFLHPEKYQSYEIVKGVIPEHMGYSYTQEQQLDAYFHPSVTNQPLTVWLPRDEAGVSAQECAHNSEVVPSSDEGAIVDEKGKVRRLDETVAPPGWEPALEW